MSLWSRFRAWQRTVQGRYEAGEPWGYPSQHDLENGSSYTPGGIDVSDKSKPERESDRDAPEDPTLNEGYE